MNGFGSKNEKAQDEEGLGSLLHSEADLFGSGKIIDPATGRPYSLSHHKAAEDVAIRITRNPDSPDDCAGDEADRWLKEHSK